MNIETRIQEIGYEDPLQAYKRESEDCSTISLFLESRSRDLRYGQQSIVVPHPAVKISGAQNSFMFEALNDAGETILPALVKTLPDYADHRFEDVRFVKGCVTPSPKTFSEDKRIRKPSLAGVIRSVVDNVRVDDGHAGLYGAIAYDFIRQFENIGSRFSNADSEFELFLPTEVLVFDEIKKTAVRKHYDFTNAPAQAKKVDVRIGGNKLPDDLSDEQFKERTADLVGLIDKGELIQAVLSKTVYVPLRHAPIQSYERLRIINPSPYCFFFNLGNDGTLFGASPELHIKIESNTVEIRPLAGTARRKGNAIDDYKARIALLTDAKERREHTMLVDLARNDIGRVCDRVEVYEFQAIEEYPNLYHIGSGVKGTLRQPYDVMDALLATIPAGTLSGAPKIRAMELIEEFEGSRRQFYGGCVGYIGFNGTCNTGITIRSTYVTGGVAHVRAGAGIVHGSDPENELAEVALKNEKMIHALGGSPK